MENKYKIPFYGLKRFIEDNPAPTGNDLHENREYALKVLPLAVYNCVCAVGMAVAGTAAGIAIGKGLETLLK